VEFKHKSVLLNECIENLCINPDGIYVDGTLGGAGHSYEIVKRLSKKGMLIGIDRDLEALKAGNEKLKDFENVRYIHGNHDEIKQILKKLNIDKVNGILLDLGVSSYQLDEKNRGFSYMSDNTILDMRMDQTQELTAEYIINNYSEEKLAEIIFEYGEDRFAKNIAKKICEYRKIMKIETTGELVKIIDEAVPGFAKKDGHPAKRTFQAIRIEVNNEIKPLYKTIEDSIDVLEEKGRLCIITFHSLEDRATKRAFQDACGRCICPPGLPYCVCGAKSKGNIITRKPILPTTEEQKNNSRAKSAKLRVFEKI
jgi:16S rRNA (cytosine1402-N4)-methyltransferase